MRKSRDRGAPEEQKILTRVAPEEDALTGTSKETGELPGEPEKGSKERLHMPRGWGKSSLRITVLWASLQQTRIIYFEQLAEVTQAEQEEGKDKTPKGKEITPI